MLAEMLTVARIALPVASKHYFDYLVEPHQSITTGTWVRVLLGRRRLIGLVIAVPVETSLPKEKLRPISAVVNEYPRLDDDVLSLVQFIANYYHQPLGMVLSLVLPPRARKERSRQRQTAQWVRLTEYGAQQQISHRAIQQQQLFIRLQKGAMPYRTLRTELSDHVVSVLREWQRKAWIEMFDEPTENKSPKKTISLNPEQRQAADQLLNRLDSYAAHVLLGVTGSGKTEVYLALIEQIVAERGQVLWLVPEINLTPQMEARIRTRLPAVKLVVLHSRLSEKERWQRWQQAVTSEAALVLGTRLAVFTPLPRLRYIVIDEEHHSSFKQQQGVQYHARDVAIWRAKQRNIPVLMGSATPALETYWNAQRGRFHLLRMAKKHHSGTAGAALQLVSNRSKRGNRLNPQLLAAMQLRIDRSEQSLLFINRRGYAPSLFCYVCGWAARCPSCAARLVVHSNSPSLQCHHCGFDTTIVAACPECGNQDLHPLGFGTQRLEIELKENFPHAVIRRIDRDSTQRKGAFASVLNEIVDGKVDIIVGTQMLAKGHDFPKLTLVGVLGADNALYSADFRATERLFAQLLQVIGRAGRRDCPGEAIIQTDYPWHALYQSLLKQDYDHFASALLAERKAADLPPHSYIALLHAEARTRSVVDRFLQAAHHHAVKLIDEYHEIKLFSPVPAPLHRRSGLERARIMIQAAARSRLQDFLRSWRERINQDADRKVRWTIEVDPLDWQ